MFDYIDKLRKKPESKRRKAVLLISFSITLAIALVWGIFFAMRVSTTDFSIPNDPSQKAIPSLRDTFSNFVEGMSKAFSSQSNSSSTQ